MSALSDLENLRLHDISDGDVRDDPRWLSLMGEDQVKAFLADMAAKHATHNQLDHGRRGPHLPDLPGDADGPRKPSSRETVKAGDFTGLKRVGGRRGSNPAGVYEADDGSKWYVKEQKSLDHARNEALAAALYREALYEGPQVFVGKGAPEMDGPQTASEWLDTDGPVDLSDERQMRDVRFGFATDAWLANWDVAGLSMDNIEVQGGFPVRVDAGGALLYRAQGGEKGDAFGDKVTEWDTLRDPGKAPQASRLFAGMSRDELIQSADQVKSINRQRIRELVAEQGLPESLADRLIARREDVLAKTERLQLDAEAERGEDRVNGALANRHALAAAPSRLTDRDKGADLESKLTFDEDPGWSERTHQASERAVRFYRNGTYRQIGSYLREDGDSTMEIREAADQPAKREDVGMHVALIDQVMEESRLKEPVLVWRGISDGKKVFGDQWSDDMTGVEWDELSFPSTSADPAVGSIFDGYGGALMRWHVPAGVGAIRLDGWKSNARHTAEAELLLDRNLRARVVSDGEVDVGGRKRRVIDVEVTPIADDDPALTKAWRPGVKRKAKAKTPGIERMTMDYPVKAVRRAGLSGDQSKSFRDTQGKHLPGVRRIKRFDPDQLRGPDGRWTDGMPGGSGPDLGILAGVSVMDAEEYAKEYGTVVDERSILDADETGMNLTARFFERGDAHVVIDLPGNRFQVMSEVDGAEGMRALSTDIRDMQHAMVPDREPTGEVVASTESPEHSLYVAKDDLGYIWLRPDGAGEEDHLELNEEEAWDFFDALEELADSFDDEFGGEEDDDDEDFDDDEKSRRHGHYKHPGHSPQSVHGRRKPKLPDAALPDVPPPDAPPKPRRAPKPKPPREDLAPASPPKPARQPRARRTEPKPEPKPPADSDYIARRRAILTNLLRNSDDPGVLRTAGQEWDEITGGDPRPRPDTGSQPAKPAANAEAEAHVAKLASQLPPALRRGATEGLMAQAAYAPNLLMRFKTIGFDVDGKNRDLGSGFAQYVPGYGIQLNHRWKTQRAKLDKAYIAEQKAGYLTPSGTKTGLGAAVAHEFGHNVALKVIQPGSAGVKRAAYDKLMGALSSSLGISPPSAMANRPVVPHDTINTWLRRNSSAITRGLSGYSAESFHELLAEAWQEYTTRGADARPAAKAVGEALAQLAGGTPR